jgi:hypothetical protein
MTVKPGDAVEKIETKSKGMINTIAVQQYVGNLLHPMAENQPILC